MENTSKSIESLQKELAEANKRILELENLQDSLVSLPEAGPPAEFGCWNWDLITNRFACSDRLSKAFGIAPGGFDEKYESFREFLHPDDRKINDNIIDKALRGSGPLDFEYRIIRPDGSVRHIHSEVEMTFDKNGIALMMIGTIYDITERKQAEKSLSESENKLRAIFNAMTDVVIELDYEGRYINIAPTAPDLLYKPADEILGKTLHEVFPKPEADIFLETVRKCLDENRILIINYSLKIKEKIFWFEGRLSPKTHNTILFIAHDDTKRKQTEEALFESREWLETTLKSIGDAVIATDVDGKIILMNNVSEILTGWKISEAEGRDIEEIFCIVNEETRKKVEIPIKKVLQDKMIVGLANHTILISKNGKKIPIDDSAAPIKDKEGNITGVVLIFKDIAERKRAEEALRESEAQYRSVFDSATDSFLIFDFDGNIVEANPQACKTYGYQYEEIVKLSGGDIVYPDYYHIFDRFISDVQKKGFFQADSVDVRKDGSLFNVEVRGAAFDYKGKPHLLAVIRDVTERKRAEDALRESEEKYRQLLETAKDTILLLDLKGNIKYVNNEGLQVSGYSKDELLEKNVTELLPDKYVPIIEDLFSKRLEGNESYNIYEIEIYTKNKALIPIEIKSTLIQEHGRPSGVLVVARDSTERKRTEEKLQKMARLESLGIIAGGLAHNIKNSLANMTFNVGLAKIKPERAAGYLEKVEKSIDQASILCTRFQTFSSGGDPIKEIINISNVIEESVSMTLSGTNIKGNVDVQDDIRMIEADRKQLNEVLTNLLINSVEAMPVGGAVEIKAGNFTVNNKKLGLPNGKYIKLSLIDGGIGIPNKTAPRIFDPFLSTKSKNRGLGLSSVYFIIQKHNGLITVDSELGKGTQFDIYLPATDKKPRKTTDNDKKLYFGDNKKILFMDDEEPLRENFQALGEVLQYQVHTVKDGYEAIAAFKKAIEDGFPYDIVILDLTIQGSDMQGEETLQELLKIDPEVKALVFSGHSTIPVAANYKEYGFSGRLEKPVSISNLSKILKDVYDEGKI